MRLATPAVLTTLLLAACAPGHLEWETGEDALRTALFVRGAEGGADRAMIFLSNGIFPCDLDTDQGESDLSEALGDLMVAACREDARHVIMHAYKRPDVEWDGTFVANPIAGSEVLTQELPRVVRADYIGVEEAQAARPSGLIPEYHPDQVTIYSGLGNLGEVRLETADEGLRGTLSFPEAHISGRFDATECSADSLLFSAIYFSPIASCP